MKKRNRQIRDCSLINEILYRCLIYKILFIKYSKNVGRFCYHLLSWKYPINIFVWHINFHLMNRNWLDFLCYNENQINLCRYQLSFGYFIERKQLFIRY